MSGRKELESGMDTTFGSNPKKVREAIERWSDNDRRILIQIIIKDIINWIQQDSQWKQIHCYSDEPDVEKDLWRLCGVHQQSLWSLWSLWKKIKAKEKSDHDRELLIFQKERSKTGDGVGPTAPQVYDPDKEQVAQQGWACITNTHSDWTRGTT